MTEHQHDHGVAGVGLPPSRHGQVNTDAEWDERYASLDQVWSGQPNPALVAEVFELPPGRVLDVGCGEGADAVWLAGLGWQVTALDVSEVALARARQHAQAAEVTVDWIHAGLLQAPLGMFDLVSAQYPALLRTDAHDAERTLLAAVAPGGQLLFVHHANFDAGHSRDNGFDPKAYVQPADMAAALDDGWRLEVHETRPRAVIAGAGAHHVEDVVLRARRLS